MKLIVCLLTAISITFTTDAQTLSSRQGQVLIELEAGDEPSETIRSLTGQFGSKSFFSSELVIASPINIWKISFDFDAISEDEVLRTAKNLRFVRNAQLNHTIQQRTIPNDPEFSDQWQYINIGQNQGNENADLDIDDAWDIATGGVTATGDTIVVCVIDDGFDSTHQDFGDNVWINYAEIPDNEIDDDGNGYIDDYYGWNADSDSDDIFSGGSHGTPVAGIVGAQGNNGIGVTGVNWDTKLMIVSGGGDEAQALSAYAYPYIMRKRYNESDGAEGAFVVSTNASWGIDMGQADDSPLWCNFYDLLGMVGIINCGATANDNVDVDVVGDLPTSCASDFLISVTNIDRKGDKVQFAGYGLETIDLGAYGEDTYTVASGNGYGQFNGTSAASPHVAGAAGLIYSAPYPGLMELAKSNPAEAALLVKTVLLEGVKKDEQFLNSIKSSGVLNLRNSFTILQSVFSACPFPLQVSVDKVDLGAIAVKWENKEEALSYDIRYKLIDSTDWTEELAVSSPFSISNLDTCGMYELQIRSNCAMDSSSDYSFSEQFTTLGCCLAVGDLVAENMEDLVPANSLLIDWPLDPDHVSYTVEIKIPEETEWQTFTSDTNSLLITGLGFCTLYEVRAKAECITGVETEYSKIILAVTACGNCTNLEYCPPPDLENFGEWIESVTIDGQLMQTGPNLGYQNNSGYFMVDINIGSEIEFKLDKGFDNVTFNEWVKVWVDLNIDGNFSEDEIVFDEGQATEFDIDTFIEVNNIITRGYTLMRVGMAFEGEPTACADNETMNFFGEYEDFCVNLVGPCDYGLTIESVFPQADQATVTFTMVDTSIAYNVRYKKVEDSDEEWETISTIDTTALLSDLEACTTYDVQVRAVCDVDTSGFMGVSEVFTTSGEGCMVPTSDPDLLKLSAQAYPNPFLSDLRIKVTSDFSDELQLRVLNLNGQLLYSTATRIYAGETTIMLPNAEEWAAGIYFVRLTSEGLEQSIKVIKLAH